MWCMVNRLLMAYISALRKMKGISRYAARLDLCMCGLKLQPS